MAAALAAGSLTTTAPAHAASGAPAQPPRATSHSARSQSAAQLTCAINDTSGCLNNTATSTFTTTTSPADADGSGNSFNAADLTSTAGWQSGKTVTVDGATITLPKFGTGTYDKTGRASTCPTRWVPPR
ncbi:hypothetical protein [Streptomyces sp. NBC_01483]|uniref:hypothetical protein n=1 Tax=Streptomyces sp. NBC_01483 TaxID=2903883 RepID=UPI002E308FC2|nr:hypothetical protein [Streptomyces sp. NBC_01483]